MEQPRGIDGMSETPTDSSVQKEGMSLLEVTLQTILTLEHRILDLQAENAGLRTALQSLQGISGIKDLR
jgi:hypothetical protein